MLKKFFYNIFENEDSNVKKIFDYIFILLIISSVSIIIYNNIYFNKSNEYLNQIDTIFTIIFMTEYIIRFWLSSNFILNVKKYGILYAIKSKIKWMLKFSSIIDLLAIIPNIRAIRMIRLLRLLRLFKLFRYSKISLGTGSIIKKHSFELVNIFLVILLIVLVGALIVYVAETEVPESEIKNYWESLWWAIVTVTTVGYGDIVPKSIIGRIFTTILMLSGIGFITIPAGMVGSILMERFVKMKEGRLSYNKIKNHIVFCGWNNHSPEVVDEILKIEQFKETPIVVISKDSEIENERLLYYKGDFTKEKDLININIGASILTVIMAEYRSSDQKDDNSTIDARTVLCAYLIEKINPNIHKIIEILDEENSNILHSMNSSSEIIFHDRTISLVFANAIKNKGSVNVLNQILSFERHNIESVKLKNLFNIKKVEINTIKDLKLKLIETDMNASVIAIEIKGENIVNPINSQNISADDTIFLLKE